MALQSKFLAARKVWAGGWRDTHNAEGVDLVASSEQMRAIGSLGDLPLRVLVSGHFLKLVPQSDLACRLHANVLDLQQDLSRLSSRSKLVVVEGQRAFHPSRATRSSDRRGGRALRRPSNCGSRTWARRSATGAAR